MIFRMIEIRTRFSLGIERLLAHSTHSMDTRRFPNITHSCELSGGWIEYKITIENNIDNFPQMNNKINNYYENESWEI